jgi:uncharacterized protein (TIGR00369 family)
MSTHTPRDPAFEDKVRESFARQKVMTLIGARLGRVEPGHVSIELPYRDDLTQQHGFLHAGILGTIADSAGGYAGFTLMPAGSSVLSVEYQIHLLEPAEGQRFVATGRVLRSGRTLTVCELEVEAVKDGGTRRCAWGSQTLICLEGRRVREG